MELQFQQWLGFYVSKRTAENYTRDVKKLFATGLLHLSDFSSSSSLQEVINTIIDANKYTSVVKPRRNAKVVSKKPDRDSEGNSEEDVGEDESKLEEGNSQYDEWDEEKKVEDEISTHGELFDPDKSEDEAEEIKTVAQNNLRGPTVNRKIYAIKYYATFLGYNYQSVDIISKQMSRRILNQTESEFVDMYLEKNVTANILNSITRCLIERQSRIHTIITWCLSKNELNPTNKTDLFSFGLNELRCFLELSLRLFVIPLEPVDVTRMTFDPHQIERDEQIEQFASKKHPNLFFRTSGQMLITYPVRAVTTPDVGISTVIVIAKYEEYIRRKIKEEHLENELMYLKGTTLGCWCKSCSCH